MGEGLKRFAKLAAGVDWPRVLQMGGTLMRELRSDSAERIKADAERASDAGRKTIEGFEQIGRQAVGCSGTAECDCAFCTERSARNG